MVRGTASPWHPLDLPWDQAPGWDGIPWDREARPSLDEVLTVRRERQAMVRRVLESLTDEELAADVTRIEPGWPQMENFPVKECLRIVLNEEWQHRLYAERDLDALGDAGLTKLPRPRQPQNQSRPTQGAGLQRGSTAVYLGLLCDQGQPEARARPRRR